MAQNGGGGGLTVGTVSIASSNSHSSQATGTGVTLAANGYMGTCFWSTTVTGAPVQYLCVYQVSFYNPLTLAWQLYDTDSVLRTDPVGSHNLYWDFFGDVTGTGHIPRGEYNMNVWICSENVGGTVGSILKSAGFAYRVHNNLNDDPVPDPEPSPGPHPGSNPPVDHPELPPSGPAGPGSVTSY